MEQAEDKDRFTKKVCLVYERTSQFQQRKAFKCSRDIDESPVEILLCGLQSDAKNGARAVLVGCIVFPWSGKNDIRF